MCRPWIDSPQPPALTETRIETVPFPEEDETVGEVMIGMFGPDFRDPLQLAALNVLLAFLCGSSISVLENTIVEREELASAILYSTDLRPNMVIWFQPTGVASEKLAEVETRVFDVLRDVASKPLDMDYLTSCLKRERRQIMFAAESSSDFSTEVINDFLFGKRDGSQLRSIGTLKQYEVLESWTEDQWKQFLRTYITEAHHVSVLGKPSSELAEKLKTDEEARVAEQKKVLGEEGLANKARALKNAIEKNNKPIPESVLQKWPVPGVESIHFIKSTTARSGLAKKLGSPENDVQRFIDAEAGSPLFVQFEDVPSNFVHLTVLLGTSEVAVEHLPLLPLFLDNFFNTPIMRDGTRVDFEQVVTELEQDTIGYSIMSGGRAGNPEGIAICFQIEPEKYAAAINWLSVLMFDSQFDEVRLKASLTKLIADVPEAKRSGNQMMGAVDVMIHLEQRSSVRAQNTLVKAVYLKRLKKMLEKEPKTVISWLEALRKSLFTFANTRVSIVANVSKIPMPVRVWAGLVERLQPTDDMIPLVKQRDRASHHGKQIGEYGVAIVPMPTVDSSFCISSVKGLEGFDDPALPAVLVSLSFLEAVEGPLWTAVRGTGLAYGASFKSDIEGGTLQFSVYRSPDAYRAFAASKAILQSYIDGTTEFLTSALEGAISGIVISYADEQATMALAGQMSFINTVTRALPPGYSDEMLKKVRQVGVEEIKAVMKDYLLPAFTPGKANIVVTCAPAMQEVSSSSFILNKPSNWIMLTFQAIVSGFTEQGFKTTVQALAEFHDDYGLQADEDGDEEDDDDDDLDGNDDDDEDEESEEE